MMKKLFVLGALSLFVALPLVHAEESSSDCVYGYVQNASGGCDPVAATAPNNSSSFVPLAPIPGITKGATADTEGLAKFFNNLYKFAIGLSAVLAIIMIIWGGLEYATQDSVSKKSDGKERIYQALFGLVLVLSPYLVFSIINPSILNLSINLPELDTKSGPSKAPARAIPDSTNGSIPFVDRTVTTPIQGAWCSRDTGSKRLLCATTEELCKAARNKNALLITEPCKFTSSP